jgi:molecular chaperone GrpE
MPMPNETTEAPVVPEENGSFPQETEVVAESGDQEERMDSLKKQLEECQAQSDNYLDQWRRAAAEFANYKKRAEREQTEVTKHCNAAVLARLLPSLDDMDRAFQNLPEDLERSPWVEGMALVHRKLHTILEQEGVRPIEAEGQRFDPVLHEAITHEPNDDVPEGDIIGEVQKGYLLNDRVLRVAKVRVSAG